MKEKILEALKTEYVNLGFSTKAINGVAESLAATGLVNDENLDAVVKGQKSALSAMQAEIDSRVTSAVEKAKAEAQKNAAPVNGGGQGNNEPTKAFDPEAYKAELLQAVREEQAAAMLQSRQQAERSATIAAKAKEFGIPEKFISKLNIPAETDLDDYFKGVRQDLSDVGFEFSEPPTQGGGLSNSGHDIAKLINKGTEEIVKHQKN
jgi:hypothetical protein